MSIDFCINLILMLGLQFNLRRRYALQYPQEATYSDPVAITIQVEATPSTTVPLHALRSQPPLVNQRYQRHTVVNV